jgi:hypothetical protein
MNVENRISILLWSDRCNSWRHDEQRSTNNEKGSREIEEKRSKNDARIKKLQRKDARSCEGKRKVEDEDGYRM